MRRKSSYSPQGATVNSEQLVLLVRKKNIGRDERSCSGPTYLSGCKLCEGETPALSANSTVASKVLGLFVGKSRMNEPSTCTPCLRNVWSCCTRRAGAGVIKVFVNRLQAFRSDGLHPKQSSLYVGPAHCVKVFGIFFRFHRDLRKEDHVLWQLRKRKPMRRRSMISSMTFSKDRWRGF